MDLYLRNGKGRLVSLDYFIRINVFVWGSGIDDSIIIRCKYWKFDIVFLWVLFFIIIVFDVIYL